MIVETVAELAVLIEEALTKGVAKEALVDAIKQLMTEASDAEMRREFPDG